MTGPTRQEIIKAHIALGNLCTLVNEQHGFTTDGYREHILKALPPKPKPTMAEIKWDDDKHYLAEAENPAWGKVLMLGMSHDSKEVTTLIKTDKVVYLPGLPPQSLTPTGKRYTLTEVQE